VADLSFVAWGGDDNFEGRREFQGGAQFCKLMVIRRTPQTESTIIINSELSYACLYKKCLQDPDGSDSPIV